MGLVLAGLISWIVLVLINFYHSKRLVSNLVFSLKYFSTQKLLLLMSFGWKVQVTVLAGWVLNNVDKLILGYFTSPITVSVYDVAYKIRNFTREPIMAYVGTLIPIASELSVKSDLETIKNFYIKTSKYLVMVLFPLAAFVFMNSSWLVRVWVGKGFEQSVYVLQILMLGNVLNLLRRCGSSIVRGINRPGMEAKYQLCMVLLTCVLGYFLTKKFGLFGLVIGSTISLGFPSLWFLILLHKNLRIHYKDYFDQVIKYPFLCIILIVLLDSAICTFHKCFPFGGFYLFLLLFFKIIFYCILYGFILEVANFFSFRQFINSLLLKIKKA
jgi:O-antigen/teichoic acid export membrane protein